jgi:hypothetical protein
MAAIHSYRDLPDRGTRSRQESLPVTSLLRAAGPTALDPERSFAVGPMNRQCTPDCGRRRNATVAPRAAVCLQFVYPPSGARSFAFQQGPVTTSKRRTVTSA